MLDKNTETVHDKEVMNLFIPCCRLLCVRIDPVASFLPSFLLPRHTVADIREVPCFPSFRKTRGCKNCNRPRDLRFVLPRPDSASIEQLRGVAKHFNPTLPLVRLCRRRPPKAHATSEHFRGETEKPKSRNDPQKKPETQVHERMGGCLSRDMGDTRIGMERRKRVDTHLSPSLAEVRLRGKVVGVLVPLDRPLQRRLHTLFHLGAVSTTSEKTGVDE